MEETFYLNKNMYELKNSRNLIIKLVICHKLNNLSSNKLFIRNNDS